MCDNFFVMIPLILAAGAVIILVEVEEVLETVFGGVCTIFSVLSNIFLKFSHSF